MYNSENKGVDQLRGNQAADLCLCFSPLQKAGFVTTWLISQVFGQVHCIVGKFIDSI